MKRTLLILSVILLTVTLIFSQSPTSFNYQAVVRDVSENIIADQTIGLQIEILQSSETGTSIYTETHSLTTNNFGLINLNIGEGSVQSGTFSTIDWGSDSYFVKVSIDITGGSIYTEIGTSQLLSVPYALYATKSANGTSQWLNTGSDIYYNTGNIGIGTETPEFKLDIRGINSDDGGLITLSNSDQTHRLLFYSGRETDQHPFIQWKDGDDLRFSTDYSGWSEKMRITSDGNIGIGTTTPNYNLDVSGNINFTGNLFQNDVLFTSGSGSLWSQNGSDIYYNSGNIGIGTATPDSKLKIETNAITGAESILKLSVSDDSESYIDFKNGTISDLKYMPSIFSHNGTDHRQSFYLIGSTTVALDDNGGYPMMNFDTRTDIGEIQNRPLFSWSNYGNHKMIMTANGNLGIGTTTPNTKLEVRGSNAPQIITNDDPFIANFHGYHENGLLVHTGYHEGKDIARFSSIGSGYIEVPRMVIKDTGNVGIGTATPNAKLDVKADADDVILFEVKDKDNNPVFSVYPDYVQVTVPEDGVKASKHGAFIVTGRSAKDSKLTTDITRLTKQNYFIGHNAGTNITTSKNNNVFGYEAGYSLTTGTKNTLIGFQSGYNITSGSDNIFIGDSTGSSFVASTSGFFIIPSNNIFMGNRTGMKATGCKNNVILGHYAVSENNFGNDNVVIGAFADPVLQGYGNVIIGSNAGKTNTGSQNIFIGDHAGFNTTGNHNILIGEYVDAGTGDYIFGIGSGSYGPLMFGNLGTKTLYFPGAYNTSIAGTYRDLYIKSDGLIGYLSSSKRYKKEINDMENINWLYELRPVNFIYKKDSTSTKQYGLIAEEVESVNKHFVSYNEKGIPETVLYSQLITPMLKALQEKNNEIDKLKLENEQMNIRLKAIEEYIKKLKE